MTSIVLISQKFFAKGFVLYRGLAELVSHWLPYLIRHYVLFRDYVKYAKNKVVFEQSRNGCSGLRRISGTSMLIDCCVCVWLLLFAGYNYYTFIRSKCKAYKSLCTRFNLNTQNIIQWIRQSTIKPSHEKNNCTVTKIFFLPKRWCHSINFNLSQRTND